MREEQAIFNLEIKKKSGLTINPDIHHSKVFSSGFIIDLWSFHIDSMPSTLQTMIFRYNYKSNDVFIHLIHYNVYLTV